ncbi:MAG: hypothetical protein PHC94_04215 [Methylobacter sp.]|nr:hypothetical protein [Methylobacter sp.]
MAYTKTNALKAVVIAMSGSVLSAGAISNANASATTMYNLTSEFGIDFSANATACAPCNGPMGSDGWVWGFGGDPQNSTSSVAKWAGTGGLHTTPFGYNGSGAVNWGLHMTANGTAEISSQDSVNRYGVGADIDTAKGAWSDAGMLNGAGRRYDLDYGLFKSDVGGTITLNAVAVNSTTATTTPNYGFTIFKGMDTNTTGYNHHGNWNAGVNANGLTVNSLPAGGTKFGADNTAAIANIVAYSIGGNTPSNINTISFNAEPGQIYTIVLGGYQNGSWADTADGYKLTVSAVPVPGAIWLFGSAMAGLIGFGRRHKNAA